METTPLISVVIPAYNCERFISQTLESVMNQTYKNQEIIVIDDCSCDSTEMVVKSYRDMDKRIFFLKNECNKGVSYTRNLGVKLAKGEWIALLDSADYWEPDKLEKQVRRLQQTNGFMCCTGRRLIDEQGNDLGKYIAVPDTITYEMLLKTNHIVCSSVLIKKSLLLEFPMEHDEMHEDYICWLQIVKKYGEIKGLNLPEVNYRMLKNSKAGNKLNSFLMQKRSYQFLGISFWRKWAYLLAYSVNGVRKYGGI